MSLSDTAVHTGLDAIATAITHVGLADRTLTELAGGSPAYARRPVAWSPSASRQKAQNGDLVFDCEAGDEACFAIYRTALTGGTDYGWSPLGGFAPFAAAFAAATDVFTSYAHGLANGQQVVLRDVQAAGLATGFVEGTIYWVVTATTDTFQLAATSGGAAITSTADMECIAQRVLPSTDAAQFQVRIPSGTLVLDGRIV